MIKRIFVAFFSFMIFMFAASVSFADSKEAKKADKFFQDGEYENAIEAYTRALDNEEDITQRGVYRYKIGLSYYRLNRPDRAEKFLGDAVKYGYMESDVYMALGEAQQKQGKYDLALTSFEAYKSANPGDPMGDVKINSCKFAKENLNGISSYELIKLDRVNSSKNEFGVSFFNESLMFSSTRSLGEEEPEKPEKEDNRFEERVIAVPREKQSKSFTKSGLNNTRVFLSVGYGGKYGRPIEVKDINCLKEFPNEGVFTYEPFSKQALYTVMTGNKAYIKFLELKSNKWVKGNQIEVKSQGEPVGQPFMTQDGNRIYFASTMPGGMGKCDIWYIDRIGQNSWSDPINAGSNINTAGNEVYPSEYGEYFFFASDGRIGFGGLDIYAAKITGGKPDIPVNLGPPFNSQGDDYNIYIRSDLSEGVLISSRNIRTGDDIYYFEGFPSNVTAIGQITDVNTTRPISNVTLELFLETKSLGKTMSDENGQFVIPVSPKTSYTLRASVPGYTSASKKFTSGSDMFGRVQKSNGIDLDFALTSNSSVISGRLYDRLTFVPLDGQTVNLSADGTVEQSVNADPSGIFKFTNLKDNTVYTVRAEPKGYFSDSKSVTVDNASRMTEYSKANGYDLDLALERYDINKETVITKIVFQEDKANLLSESYKELDRLADMFKKNPQCKIDLTGYVSLKVNTKIANELSLKRVNTVRDYLVSQKVSPAQLRTRSMGRQRPLVVNPRTDEEHEQNNRITYTVNRVDEQLALRNDNTSVATRTTDLAATNAARVNQSQTTANVSTNNRQGTATQTLSQIDPAQSPFRVQVAALRVLDLRHKNFIDLKIKLDMDIKYELGADGLYRYFVGGFMNRTEAQDAADRIKALGMDCTIKSKP